MKSETSVVEKQDAADEPVLVTKTVVYRMCSLGSRIYCGIWHRLRVEGVENLPREGGAVLACNHQSFLDILILGGYVPRHTAFVARDTLANWRWLAYVMRECGTVLVKRGTSDRRALRAMAQHLELGDCVAIFPEGTRSLDGKLGEMKGGALLAARMAKVPIVPLGIRGAHEAWPKGRPIPFPRKIALRFGEPVDSARDDAQELVAQRIRAMIGDGTYRSVAPIR